VQKIPITIFRAKLYAIIEKVRLTRQPIMITRYGKPLSEIWPVSDNIRATREGQGSRPQRLKAVPKSYPDRHD